eukprot:GHUV01030924.1.p2 GENE.GHUV01030924.1~~GHUV01030924.1.p2  ORF type:complete len:107 (-),score=0.85 GHUV01030924.1:50-370(-)
MVELNLNKPPSEVIAKHCGPVCSVVFWSRPLDRAEGLLVQLQLVSPWLAIHLLTPRELAVSLSVLEQPKYYKRLLPVYCTPLSCNQSRSEFLHILFFTDSSLSCAL